MLETRLGQSLVMLDEKWWLMFTRPLALLFFNIGIEIGQIAFIFLVWGLWLLIRKPLQPWQERLLPVPVYILGALSAMWCIERGLEALA